MAVPSTQTRKSSSLFFVLDNVVGNSEFCNLQPRLTKIYKRFWRYFNSLLTIVIQGGAINTVNF